MFFNDPHHPFTPPGSYWGRYDPDEMVLPSSHGAEHNAPPPLQTKLKEAHARGERIDVRVEAHAVTERETSEAIALTYDMLTFVDDAIGRLLKRLDELGLRGKHHYRIHVRSRRPHGGSWADA